jgi:hypothetical protein
MECSFVDLPNFSPARSPAALIDPCPVIALDIVTIVNCDLYFLQLFHLPSVVV